MVEPYFEYVTGIETNALDVGVNNHRPPTRDVIFVFPKETFGRYEVKVRFHGERHNRFVTTFPKMNTDDWKRVPDFVDPSSLILTARAYVERVYGVEAKTISNYPPNLEV